MGKLIRLDEWATARGLSPSTVRRHWVREDGFPKPKDTEPRVGSGTPYQLFDEDELDTFAKQHEAARMPRRLKVPPEPDSFRTLGGIARLLGLDGKSVTQYRAVMDERAAHRDKGRQRLYRTRDVVAVLNERRGSGVARDGFADRRRGPRPQ